MRLSHTLVRLALVRRCVVATAVLAAFPSGQALAKAAGHIDFATTGVAVMDESGRARAGRKGVEIGVGDRIHTNAGRAQVRFTDGGYISIQPYSEFIVRNYRYAEDGSADAHSLFALMKGAIRAITGAIGKNHRTQYAIATPVVTIGVRGTGGLIEVLEDGRTRLVGTSGVWTVANAVASVDVPAGYAVESGADRNHPLRQSRTRPVLPPPAMALEHADPHSRLYGPRSDEDHARGDDVGGDGVPSSYPRLANGSYGIAALYLTNTAGTVSTVIQGITPVSFDRNGLMTGFVDPSTGSSYGLQGTNVDAGNAAGVMAWGRWTGGVTLNSAAWRTFAANDGIHYVVGVPTAPADVQTGVVATFSLLGGTRPTDGTNVGTLDPSSTLIGYFTPGNPTVGLDLGMSVGGNTYRVQTPVGGGMPITVNGSNAPFAGSTSTATLAVSGCAAGVACAATVSGQFFGAGAPFAGLTYWVANGTTQNVTGSATFQRQ